MNSIAQFIYFYIKMPPLPRNLMFISVNVKGGKYCLQSLLLEWEKGPVNTLESF